VRAVDSFRDAVDVFETELAARRGVDADRVPILTVSDALELVDVWTSLLGQLANGSGADLLVARWGRLVGDTVAIASHFAGDDVYPDPDRVLWEVRRLASHFDHVRALAGGLGAALRVGLRNAAVSVHGDEIKIDNVKDPVDLWGALLRHYKETRGVDGDANAGEVPRTRIGEVLALAAFWTAQISELQLEYTAEVNQQMFAWLAYLKALRAKTKDKPETEVYGDNRGFWDVTGELAIALNVGRRAAMRPSWSFLTSLEKSIKNLPETLGGVLASVKHAATETAAATYDAAKDVASDLSGGLSKALGNLATPLIVGGAVVIGAVVLVPALFRSGGAPSRRG
jgi:hypothetical protein